MTERDFHFTNLYQDVISSNKRWQEENANPVPIEERVISDINHGTEWAEHEHLSAADFGDDVRMAFTAYADDVDIPNPIGQAAGHHKMTFVYTVCLNRDIRERTSIASINLATIVLSKDLKEFTPAVVISGAVDEPESSTSLGACLRRFEEGVWLEVPGEEGLQCFRGWLFSFVGDAPAVAEMVGTKISFSKAHNVCNMCENAHRPLVYKPSRWMGCKCPDDRNHIDGCLCPFALRTADRDAEARAAPQNGDKLKDLGVNTWEHAFVRVPTGGRSLAQQPGPKDAMHVWLEGITKSFFSYTTWMMVKKYRWCTERDLVDRANTFPWPQKEKTISRPGYMPPNLFTGRAARGRSRGRGHGRGRGRGTRSQSSTAPPPASPPAPAPTHNTQSVRPRRAPPQPFTEVSGSDSESHSELDIEVSSSEDEIEDEVEAPQEAAQTNTAEEGTTSRRDQPPPGLRYAQGIPTPKKEHNLPGFTAHHMLILTLHSLELFRPFVPKNARADHPWWDVWVHHVYILQTLMKPSFTYSDLTSLDQASHTMFSLFDTVPEYSGFWVPKFHFAQHAAMDIMRFGPTRCNWCFMYEAKNQPMKRGCKRSNFHSPCKSTALHWVESTDCQLRKRKKRKADVGIGKVDKEGRLRDFLGLASELQAMAQHARVPSEEAVFQRLESATKYGVCFYPQSLALVPQEDGGDTICRIQAIFAIDSNVYVIVDVFPPDVMHHDQNGVLYTEIEELKSKPTLYTILPLHSTKLTALWSFLNGGAISFVTKW